MLRGFQKEDFEAVHAYVSNPDNVKYMTWGPYNEAGTESFINKCIERQRNIPRLFYDFVIVLKEAEKLIGSCGIYLSDDLQQANMGWILHMKYWKQGYMPEAVRALLKFGFEELTLHRMCAYCNVGNYGTYKVMEKCGMRKEATFIKSKRGRPGVDDEWFDEFMYAILADEWHTNFS